MDCFCACETFLDSTFCDSEISINDYITFRKDRLTNGGGLVANVKNHLNCVCRLDLESKNMESIWLEFKFPSSRPFLICYTYRPPSAKVDWLHFFSESLESSRILLF